MDFNNGFDPARYARGIDPQILRVIDPNLARFTEQSTAVNAGGRTVRVAHPEKALINNRYINQHVQLPAAKAVHERKVEQKFRYDLPVAKPENIKFIKKLGKGGFGQVYMVKNRAQQHFALKMVGTNPELRHECAVMLKLSRSGHHKNLINVIAVSPGRSPDKYMLMELGGSSLHKDLYREGRMRDDELRDSFSQILKGASAIEEAGLQHNDLKPENILIDNKGCLKICDFGLAEPKEKMSRGGTTIYMSPEKLGLINSQCPGKSDSWALGCVFAEMRLGYPIMADLLNHPLDRPSKNDIERVLSNVYTEIRNREGHEAAELFHGLMQLNPIKRISPSEALKHPYFSKHRE